MATAIETNRLQYQHKMMHIALHLPMKELLDNFTGNSLKDTVNHHNSPLLFFVTA